MNIVAVCCLIIIIGIFGTFIIIAATQGITSAVLVISLVLYCFVASLFSQSPFSTGKQCQFNNLIMVIYALMLLGIFAKSLT